MGFFDSIGSALAPALAAKANGDQMTANLDATKADTALKMQSLAMGQLQQQQMQQQMQQQQDTQQRIQQLAAGWDQQQQAAKVADGTAPDVAQEQQLHTQASQYRQLANAYLATNPTLAQSYSKLADAAEGKVGEVREQNMKLANEQAQKTASFAGSVLNGDVPPDQAFQWVKNNIGLQEAMSIPTDPTAAKAYWKSKQAQGLTAQQQITNAFNVQKQQDSNDQSDQEHEDRQAALRQQAADRAASRELLKSRLDDAAAARADRATAAKQASDFRQTTQLNTNLQRQAKPYLDDLQRLDELDGLLQTNSSAADQQIHQGLVSLLGNFKGRATSQYYKDNQNFGSAANRLTGMLSHGFTGQYQDSDRQAIQQLIQNMRNNVVSPALNSMEQGAKTNAKGFGLDPDQVQVNADFTRGNAAPAPAAGKYSEGQTATGANGQKIVFHNGRWVAQ